MRELLRSVSIFGQNSAQTRTVLSLQSELLQRLYDQFFQATHDSVEFMRCVADQTANVFHMGSFIGHII